MNFVKIGLLAAISIALAGCSTSNPVPLNGAAPVANKKEVKSSVADIQKSIEGGNVIFIRRYAQPTAYPISVRVDGEKVASLGQRKYTAINLPKGEYEFVAKWPFIATQLPIEFTAEVTGDGQQFFEFLGQSTVEGYGYSGASYANYVGARELEPEDGAEYLSKCCVYVKPKNQKK